MKNNGSDTNNNKNKKYNNLRAKKRLDRQTGIEWIDPECGYGPVRGERALWRAVILQMLEDAASSSKKTNDQYNKTMARNWLEANSTDFYMVCDLAGFDIEYARKMIKRALLNNCKWRKEPKKSSKSTKKVASVKVERKDVSALETEGNPRAPANNILVFEPFHTKMAYGA